jgi:hypothetical protein
VIVAGDTTRRGNALPAHKQHPELPSHPLRLHSLQGALLAAFNSRVRTYKQFASLRCHYLRWPALRRHGHLRRLHHLVAQGRQAPRLLQGVAAGWLGHNSFNGGMATAALGLAFHFLIAFTAAGLFYAASRHLAFMIQQPVVSGVLYGIMVYLVMYWLVMPLSNFHRAQTVTSSMVAIITHVICVGLPISLVIHRFSR